MDIQFTVLLPILMIIAAASWKTRQPFSFNDQQLLTFVKRHLKFHLNSNTANIPGHITVQITFSKNKNKMWGGSVGGGHYKTKSMMKVIA